eukprot:gene10416-3202_t
MGSFWASVVTAWLSLAIGCTFASRRAREEIVQAAVDTSFQVLWPIGEIIPYYLEDVDPEIQWRVRRAMAEIERKTCI